MTAADRPTPNPGIMDIDAYVPGKSAAHPGAAKVYKLSSNENPFGASPKAIEAVREAAGRMEFYPDGKATRLRQAIADMHGLNPQNIVVFNGSDEALALLARIYLAPGDEAIMSQYGFLQYPIYIRMQGATVVVAPERDQRTDVDAILGAVTAKTKMVFLANPNNPTGTYIPFDEIRRLQAGLPRHVMLVLDAAYAEFVRKNDYEAGVELVASCENVVMTRTFSKVYGLGGARIGWFYAPGHIIEAVERVRDPFNVSVTSIEAGIAAVKDRAHADAYVQHNEKWRDILAAELGRIGLTVTPSAANFILVHFPDEARHSAAEADEYLLARGFILRRVAAYGFPNALRMSIGTEEANRGVIA
ncbi:histidinol-phosphate transaminase, partial [Escherichia coli]|nr:histidinol-phosphate transaminase [Escherichia coli]